MRRVLLGLTRCFAVACCVGGLGASAAHAATLNVVAGQLVGASGVDVGGDMYDVSFDDGSCISLFSGCDAISDFAFGSQAAAIAAAQALLDQVFIDGAQGAFDTMPNLTRGCTDSTICDALIPFALDADNAGNVILRVAVNWDAPQSDTQSQFSLSAASDFTGTDNPYAVFTAVPEPGTGILLGAGLVLLSVRRRTPAAR